MKKYLAEKVKKAYQDDSDFYELPYYLNIDETKGWPKIPEHNFPEALEKLDMENFEWLEITDTKAVVCCGGDWQTPMKVTMELKDGKLIVTDIKNDFFKDGLSENKFNKLLFGTIDYDKIINN